MTNVIELFPQDTLAKIKDESAQRELLDYLLWSMKFDEDPHASQDDPIAEFRKERDARIHNKSTYVA